MTTAEQPTYEIASVLFMDIVAYSLRSIEEQIELLTILQRIVRESLEYARASGKGELISLPTGDGMALVFLRDPVSPVKCALEIAAAVRNHQEMRLRMGIHQGPVCRHSDIKEEDNVVGGGINMAQRVMDCGDAGHILLSRNAAEVLQQLRDWNGCLEDLGIHEVKHEVGIQLYNFCKDGLGNPARPSRIAPLAPTGPVGKAPIDSASIAVLPFVNLGEDKEHEYFSDGLAEELMGALNKLGKVRVAPRSSAFSFRGQTKDVREIGRTLNVASVLEGSLRSSGRSLRINVQLIRVADGSALWSERFDRELTDIFEVQDEIAAAVVGKLRSHLLGDQFEEPAPAAKRFTEDPEAYSLYLKGRYLWIRRPAATQAAIECFQQALQRDPKYALAYASLADCYNTLGSWEAGILAPEDAYSKGRAYAERSLQLDPNLAEGHCALGYALLHFAWDLRAAERSFTVAIRLSPGYGPAIHWYAHLLSVAERFEEALERSRQYLDLDPSDPFAVAHLSWHSLMENDFAMAEREGRAAVNQEPGFGWHHVFLGWGLLASGLLEEGCSEIEKGTRLNGGVTVCENFAAHAHAIAGRRDAALAQLDQLKQISQSKYVSPYEIGLIHEALGDRDEAFRQWELAFEQRSPWLVYLAREPRLMHLRGQPQFDALLARIHRLMNRDTKRL
jgi:TolB-like protein/class 3 adenylate cyclase